MPNLKPTTVSVAFLALAWCHLKTTSQSTQFETHNCFSCLFGTGMKKGFSSKRTSLKVDFTGPENILFAGASVHLSAGKFYSEGVKKRIFVVVVASQSAISSWQLHNYSAVGLLGSRKQRCSWRCESPRAHLEIRRSTSVHIMFYFVSQLKRP